MAYAAAMNLLTYTLVHVLCVVFLTAFTFQALAAPVEENRRRLVMTTGVLALVLFVAGFGALAKGEFENMGWVVVKVLCALVLAGLAPMAFKRPEAAGRLVAVAVVVVSVALCMVYLKPF